VGYRIGQKIEINIIIIIRKTEKIKDVGKKHSNRGKYN
jgi:hypothetical protein